MRLTRGQIRKLSDILSDVGQVLLAGIVVPPLVGEFSIFSVVIGLTLALGFWIMSLFISA